MELIPKRVKTIIEDIKHLRYSHIHQITNLEISKGDYTYSQSFQKQQYQWESFKPGQTWGGLDSHYWFYTDFKIPEPYAGKNVRLFLNTGANDIWNTDNPQILVYLNGCMAATMDLNHNDMELTKHGTANELVELAFYAYSNTRDRSNFFSLSTAVFHEEVDQLYYDMKVLYEAADCLCQEDDLRWELFEVLNGCVNCLDLRQMDSEAFYQSVRTAGEYLRKQYYEKTHELSPVTVYSTGHTHIDVAWKWPLRQTRQKAVRSFQTVLNLMKQYPEYQFMSSQPQLYEFVKEDAPWLFEQIKERVLEGRWETEGAMWLEADCNLSSGESLIRHILYGRKFFQQEFGTGNQNEVLWLPDVFGYSVALPQILKKSGIRYFMTTKIGWNEYNQIPNDTMMWQGLDGSRILTHFITTTNYCSCPKQQKSSFSTTYNGMQNVKQIMGTWQRYQNKSLSRDVLTCFGYGDGGGGTTEEMLKENRRIAQGVGRCPRTKLASVKEFFRKLEKNLEEKKVPVWNGELYLEFHRGTYTSMARNKRNNRQCEFLAGDAEFFQVLAGVFDRNSYPKNQIEQVWKLVLLNQFHDILPGSSIKEVYEDSDVQYQEARSITEALIEDGKHRVLEAVGGSESMMCVFNQLSFQRSGLIKLSDITEEEAELGGWKDLLQKTWDGSYLYLANQVNAKGVAMFSVSEKKPGIMESVVKQVLDEKGRIRELQTEYYRIQFNDAMEFASLYDKEESRELIQMGEMGNRLIVFEDRPQEYDSWNIDAYYQEKSWNIQEMQECCLEENGSFRASLFIRRRFLNSEIRQHIYFYHHTKRIDFETEVDWNESQLLLKAAFPVDILANKAAYEVQFGNVERPTHENTSWDLARFEVCGHKWADISECGYGVALMNDCKYGYDIHDSVMRLTLIKSGIFPNPEADRERHLFTYSLYPHKGDFREGRVIQEAYDLNCPLSAIIANGKAGFRYSYLSVDAPNVFADTIKQSEDENGVVIRLYEAYGKRTQVYVRLAEAENKTVYRCNCMEEEREELKWEENGLVQLWMHPYEILTLYVDGAGRI